MKVKLFFAALVLVTGVPAQANWQWTKWGMSEVELVAASPAPLTIGVDDHNSDEVRLNIEGTYSAGDTKYSVLFQMSRMSETLVGIVLRPVNSSCSNTKTNLTLTYGEAFAVSGYPGLFSKTIWRDVAKGNQVQFMALNTGDCTVSYAPLESTGDSGL